MRGDGISSRVPKCTRGSCSHEETPGRDVRPDAEGYHAAGDDYTEFSESRPLRKERATRMAPPTSNPISKIVTPTATSPFAQVSSPPTVPPTSQNAGDFIFGFLSGQQQERHHAGPGDYGNVTLSLYYSPNSFISCAPSSQRSRIPSWMLAINNWVPLRRWDSIRDGRSS